MPSVPMSKLRSSRCASSPHVLRKGTVTTVSPKAPPRIEAALYGEHVS